MVLFSLSRKINRIVGPPSLRYGLSLRYTLGSATRDNPILDSLLFIPFSQKMAREQARLHRGLTNLPKRHLIDCLEREHPKNIIRWRK